MSMIKYSGMSLQEFVGAQIFDPPRLCLVWDDDEFNENTIHEKSYVCVIIPPTCEAEHRVVTCNGVHWKHCALLPENPAQRRATNRELAKWLAQGNGEISGDTKEYTIVGYYYAIGDENTPVKDGIKVRKWSDTEWHTPDVEYMGIQD